VHPGVFDWYTSLAGAFALCALAGHGGFYLAWKTAGLVQERSRAWARTAWQAVLPLWLLATLATAWIQPEVFTNLIARPWSLGFVLMMLAGLVGGFRSLSRENELAGFLSSAAFLLGVLGATMAGNYPVWLRSTLDPAHSLTAENSAAAPYGLRAALVWWTIGITLAAGYFVYVFRSIRGKVGPDIDQHGY
jgi:cytochrome d ubiquinol oxidase subunit II